MDIRINGRTTTADRICVNQGMNFSQFRLEDAEIAEYQLVLSKADFIELLQPDFDKVRDKIKEDDESYGDRSDFAIADYASLEEHFNYPEALLEIIKGYFDQELLVKLFPDAVPEGYMLNSIEGLDVMKEVLVIKGRAYKLPVKKS